MGGASILAKLSTVPVQRERLLREQDWQAPHCAMQGDRPLRLCAGVFHPRPQRHWHCFCSCTQEATDDGRYR
ncbi:rCG30829 [Rattus norvegicus]|uniref:RCG30829 n=1 Tax=Rattus norvegicus TaxID=10116 RepID=A6IU73_RAT|nr:rCG30829 [Rattus norvegicus]